MVSGAFGSVSGREAGRALPLRFSGIAPARVTRC